jgi:uncharacterized phage-associated protein
MPAVKHVADDEKLRELILLISQESEGDAPFGSVKLNKLLFYVDFLAFTQFGKPVTGQEYQRLPNGPAPRRLLPLTKQMEGRGEFAIAQREFFGRQLKRPMALREPDLSKFSADEVSLVHKLLKRWWGKTASEISERSHRFAGWKLAGEKETIPYTVALVNRGPRSKAADAYASTLGDKARDCLKRV